MIFNLPCIATSDIYFFEVLKNVVKTVLFNLLLNLFKFLRWKNNNTNDEEVSTTTTTRCGGDINKIELDFQYNATVQFMLKILNLFAPLLCILIHFSFN